MSRGAVVITLAVVAAVFSADLCAAKNLVWRGGNTNFNNADNWDGALPLESSDVASVDLRSERAYTSFISSETYSVGSRMKLPMNGRFVFQSDQAVVIKFNEQASGPEAQFKGPRDDIEFSFNCPDNWRIYRGTSLDATTEPPREDDDVFFEPDSSYHVFSDAPLTNVASLTIGHPSTAGLEIEDCRDLPAPQFDGLDCSRFFINDETACTDEFSFNDEGTRACMYYNSCPTEEQAAEQAARLVEGAQYKDAEIQAAAATLDTVNFQFDLAVDALSQNEDVRAAIDAALQDEDSLAALAPAMLPDLNGTSFTWTVWSLSAAYSDMTLTLSGVATAPRAAFAVPGTDPRLFDPTATLTLANPTAGVDGAFQTETRVLARVHVAALASAHATADALAAVNTTCADEAACTQIASVVQALSKVDKAAGSSFDTSMLVSTVCKDYTCPSDPDQLKAAIAQALGNDTTVSDDDIAALAGALTGLNATDNGDLQAFLESDNAIAAGDALNTADAAVVAAQPITRTIISDPIVFGVHLPALTLRLLVNTANRAAFIAEMKQRFLAAVAADEVLGMELILSTSANTGSDSSTARRRRAAGDDANVVVELIVTYKVTCLEDLCDALVVTSDHPSYQALVAAANGAAATIDPQAYECFITTLSSGAIQIDDLPSSSCLYDRARELLAASGGDAAAAYDALIAATTCGPAGSLPTGDCVLDVAADVVAQIETRVQNAVNAATTTTSTTTATKPVISTSSSSTTAPVTIAPAESSAASVGVIAGGAAAGVVALIAVVILIVVLQRRGGSRSSGKAGTAVDANRHVVAFENPMYDDPGLNPAMVQPVYEAAGDKPEEEGLYDEPAFTVGLNDKTNPIYQSNEDLAESDYDNIADSEDDGPDGTGYLDVAPEVEDE
ncbi:hypothetical protein PTSG_11361 [Salpingoeca rosetta]|uniref:Protein amnionless n=1 Tax=Salpingoeca rosetta (strain ATCC 50818 / BSB-021) TaxID=946362 RepID=F2UT64_SALR5|nr:uncharacterized protein PTSG_11361 [Salpingoeca rosetta]EGD81323.1 hypothetical protein PTSG_11361 [Salpingoeca rosetta]|eukprot:XP_004987638.1 hypothetical protein PTSG_11361 [Salpingoeca rosetta]